MISKPEIRWGVKFRSKCLLDGERSHLINKDFCPVMYRTRQGARDFINMHYGFLRERPDLKKEPHGWKIPIPVKVLIKEIG